MVAIACRPASCLYDPSHAPSAAAGADVEESWGVESPASTCGVAAVDTAPRCHTCGALDDVVWLPGVVLVLWAMLVAEPAYITGCMLTHDAATPSVQPRAMLIRISLEVVSIIPILSQGGHVHDA